MKQLVIFLLALTMSSAVSSAAFAATKKPKPITCPAVVDRELGEYSSSKSKYRCYKNTTAAKKAGFKAFKRPSVVDQQKMCSQQIDALTPKASFTGEWAGTVDGETDGCASVPNGKPNPAFKNGVPFAVGVIHDHTLVIGIGTKLSSQVTARVNFLGTASIGDSRFEVLNDDLNLAVDNASGAALHLGTVRSKFRFTAVAGDAANVEYTEELFSVSGQSICTSRWRGTATRSSIAAPAL